MISRLFKKKMEGEHNQPGEETSARTLDVNTTSSLVPTSKGVGEKTPLVNIGGDPFKRSSRVMRSPAAKPDNADKISQRASIKDASSEPEAITKLGAMIKNLMEYVNARHNVHHAIKDQVRAIRAAYLEVREELKQSSEGKKQGETAALQSTPRVLLPSRGSPFTIKETPELRKRPREANGEPESPRRSQKRKMEKTPPRQIRERLPEPTAKDGNSNQGPTWTKVEKKKKLQKRSRPDALIITKTSELTYADILRKVKTDTSLMELGESVNRIRRTQKGDLLLEFKPGENKSEDLQKKIESSLG